jgi:hypothetical protein
MVVQNYKIDQIFLHLREWMALFWRSWYKIGAVGMDCLKVTAVSFLLKPPFNMNYVIHVPCSFRSPSFSLRSPFAQLSYSGYGSFLLIE